MLLLIFLYGISNVIDRSGLKLAVFLAYNPILTIAAVLIGGAITGLITVYLSAFLFELTGKLIGGHGTSENLRAAIVWSNIPNFWVLPLDILYAALLPTLAYLSKAWAILLLPIPFLSLAVGVWSLVLMLQAVGEVHGFSAWKALATVALSFLAILFIVFVIALVVILPIKVLS